MSPDLFSRMGVEPKHQDVELGPKMGRFIALAARDFPHVAALMLLEKNRTTRYKAGEIAKLIGESRRRTARVLKDLEGAKLVLGEGALGRTFRYDSGTPHESLVQRFIKLWSNPVTHGAVTRKILEQK